ncbi:MAG: sulfite exporter TauE/SafE family protein [Acidimicrobiales bacterium]|nr:MAG: hypothetical protein MB52_07665 [marine actinobacterium MedAcidi-G1]HAQ03987.1 integrase [Acidimicrobiaceae bacterium]|tara:strand:- start:1466 stop:2203 length:738 start_codon:yes stop_codon:yes gene_type:complete
MALSEVLLLAFGGLAAGVINTMAGGGSTITVPLLVFAGVPGTYANGSNRVGILPACLAAVLSFRRLGVSGFRDARIIFLPVLFGSLAGSLLINKLGDDQFERLFAFLVIPIVILTLMPPTPKESKSSWGRSTMILIFFVVGVYGGAIQAGVGLVIVLALSRSGFDLVTANSIKVMINAFVTVVALPVFIFSGKISWGPALVLAAGLTLGGWIGAKWTVEGGERVVRWVMVIAALGLSGKLVGLYG